LFLSIGLLVNAAFTAEVSPLLQHRVLEKTGGEFKLIRKAAASAQDRRVCLALDCCTVSVMVVDEGNRVIYVNEAAENLFSRYEAQIRAAVPTFDARSIVGTDVQVLAGVEPASFAGLDGVREQDCKLGSTELRVSINPMVDAQGQPCGAVLEWSDRILEVSKAGGTHPAQQSDGATTTLQHVDESLRKMTGLIEEMARKAGRYAQHADQASGAVVLTRQRIMKQSRVAEEVTASTARWLRQIADVSRAIGDIVRVIEETVSRSRLLLTGTTTVRNSVAAQKDRWIPVAEEIVALTTLSVHATQVAKQLIDALVQRAADGAALVTRNGEGLSDIFDSLDEAAVLVTEVAAVAHEHSQEILEVSTKVAALCQPKKQIPGTAHNCAAERNTVVPFKRRIRIQPPPQAR
jgi:methyl-accepting chemotaxis protein